MFDPVSQKIFFGYREITAKTLPNDGINVPEILSFYGTSATNIGYVEIEGGERVEKTLDLQDDIDGRSSFAYLTATEKGLYAHVGTPHIEPYMSRDIWGGIINTDTGNFSPLFPNPPYFKGPSPSQSNYRTDSLRATLDGRTAVFSHGIHTEAVHPENRVAVGRGGMIVIRDGIVAEQILPPRGRGPREVAISGDGKKAIMTVFNDSRIFWAVDLQTREIVEKPLRAPLEAAIAQTRLRNGMPPPPAPSQPQPAPVNRPAWPDRDDMP